MANHKKSVSTTMKTKPQKKQTNKQTERENQKISKAERRNKKQGRISTRFIYTLNTISFCFGCNCFLPVWLPWLCFFPRFSCIFAKSRHFNTHDVPFPFLLIDPFAFPLSRCHSHTLLLSLRVSCFALLLLFLDPKFPAFLDLSLSFPPEFPVRCIFWFVCALLVIVPFRLSVIVLTPESLFLSHARFSRVSMHHLWVLLLSHNAYFSFFKTYPSVWISLLL